MQLFQSFLELATVLAGLTIIFSHTQTLGGWLPDEVLAIVGVYSFWLILATLSFWFVRVENILVIFQSMYEAGRWSISLYPGWLRFAPTFIVPVAFATTVPAEALIGRLTEATRLGAVIIAVVLFVASRTFCQVGLRQYSGTSA